MPAVCSPVPLVTLMVLLESISTEPLSLTAAMPTLAGSAPETPLALEITVMKLPVPVLMVTLPLGEPPVAMAATPALLSPATLITSPAPTEMVVGLAPEFCTRMPARPPALVEAPAAFTVSVMLAASVTLAPPVLLTRTPA